MHTTMLPEMLMNIQLGFKIQKKNEALFCVVLIPYISCSERLGLGSKGNIEKSNYLCESSTFWAAMTNL